MVEVVAQFAGLEAGGEVGEDGRDRAHLGDGVKFDVAEMRVGEDEGGREGAEDDVSELDAVRGDDVAEREVVFAEEFGEVVKQNKKKTEGSAVEVARGCLEFGGLQEGRHELEQRQEELVESRPSLKYIIIASASTYRTVQMGPLTSRFCESSSFGMKRRWEIRLIHEKAKPGK